MRYSMVALILLAACGEGITTPAYHCANEKRIEWAEYNGGEMPVGFLESDVWRINPILTLYFEADCTVTKR